MSHVAAYLAEAAVIARDISCSQVELLAEALDQLRSAGGRLYVIGLGGSLSNAEHLAADFRKLCEIEAYAPNAPEMSAWINDAGPYHAFRGHLKWMRERDALLVLSVGGGTAEVSTGLLYAITICKAKGMPVFSIVGPNGGCSAENSDICIKVPVTNKVHVTPHTEAFQAVIWHALVSHPLLQKHSTKW